MNNRIMSTPGACACLSKTLSLASGWPAGLTYGRAAAGRSFAAFASPPKKN